MSVDWVSSVDEADADEQTPLRKSSKDELIEKRGEIDFLKDRKDGMTYGRRIGKIYFNVVMENMRKRCL